MISAIATWDDGNMPADELLESPLAFRHWFDQWVQRQKDRRPGEHEAEVNGFVIHD